ncbi:MAG: stage 0 sporulation family protein [Clostridia bacterium]|nr:stage 0 sporulation family protein [Clostridia bacterium]
MDKENEKKQKSRRNHRPFHKKHAPHNKDRNNQTKKAGESSGNEPREGTPLNTNPSVDTLPLTPTKVETDFSDPPVFLKTDTDKNDEKFLVVGIRFRPLGKTYSFDPGETVFFVGDPVIVETSQGTEFGTVATAAKYVSKKDVVLPLKKILRKANENDIKRHEENQELERRGRKVFLEKAVEHKLDMALSDVECSFDRSKIIFYFTSEGRVDFREFVKDVASIFRTRIELRQIGVRDEAKQLGGLGICGRPLCCSSFLDDFQQVSIKMAKEQNLSLNPTKISGSCGRLMCCLRYENDVYVEAAKKCPRAESSVMTPKGKGTVVEANILCGKCKVRLDSDPENILPFDAEELKLIPKIRKNQTSAKNDEDPGEGQENSRD